MERGSKKRSSSTGSEKMERVGGRYEKNGRTLFDRPKPTVGCSVNGRRKITGSVDKVTGHPPTNCFSIPSRNILFAVMSKSKKNTCLICHLKIMTVG